MRTRTHLLITFVILIVAISTTASQAVVLSGPGSLNVDSILSANPIPDGQPYRRDVVVHDSLATVEILQLREGTETVSHKIHHLSAWVMRGAVRVSLGTAKDKVPAGTIVNIPPGTAYAFHNMAHAPVVIVCVYTPKFSGKDRQFQN